MYIDVIIFCTQMKSQIIHDAVKYGEFEYLSLLLKYLDKNWLGLRNAINYKDLFSYPLLYLLKSDHLDEEWLLLLFKICKQCTCNMESKQIDEAIEYIDKNKEINIKLKNADYKSIIKSNV